METADVQELVEKYRRLIPANKANALSNLRVALAAQENTKKAMEAERRLEAEKAMGKPAA